MKTGSHQRTLVLASQSPRRRELLARAGFEFTVSHCQISEIPDENLNLPDQISDIARRKAEACLEMGKVARGHGNLVLSADTVVVLDGQILGKPQDRQENAHYLRRLSGQTHTVITGVCLFDIDTGERLIDHETSQVLFRSLSETDIANYCAAGSGLDKAGGYGIQDDAGAVFVDSIQGAYDNVVGLPITLFERMLRDGGWDVKRAAHVE